jgi:hypothetical protein
MSAAPKKTYRICCYDAANRILTAELVDAASDEAAVAMADATCAGQMAEIWQGRRLVAQLEAERRQA